MKAGDLVVMNVKASPLSSTLVKVTADGVAKVESEEACVPCLVLEAHCNAVKILHPDGSIKCGIKEQWKVVSKFQSPNCAE